MKDFFDRTDATGRRLFTRIHEEPKEIHKSKIAKPVDLSDLNVETLRMESESVKAAIDYANKLNWNTTTQVTVPKTIIDSLEAENLALRAALKEISGCQTEHGSPVLCDGCKMLIDKLLSKENYNESNKERDSKISSRAG